MANLPFEIGKISMTRVDLRLKDPMNTAHGIISERPILILRADTSLGEGIGECSALADPYYSSEYLAVSEFILRDFILPHIMRLSPPLTLSDILAFFDKIKGYPYAKAAVEMAFLDLLTKSQNISLLSFLANGRPVKNRVPASMSVGISPDLKTTVSLVGTALEKGYRRIKCKIAPDHDINLLKAIFAAYPHETDLRLFLDANESYSCDKKGTDLLIRIGNFDERIAAVEEPLRHGQIPQLVKLRNNLECCLLLDESAGDLFRIGVAGELGLCDGVVIKPSRLGGVLPSLDALNLATKHGLQTSLGGMYEAGIGRAVSLAMESLEMITLGGDLGPSDNYYTEDVTAPHLLNNGFIKVPDTVGLGVKLLNEGIFDSNNTSGIPGRKKSFGSIYPPLHFFPI